MQDRRFLARTVAALGTAAALTLTPVAASAQGVPHASTTVTEQIPWSAPDLVNQNRGQYRWGGITKWYDIDGKLFPNSNPTVSGQYGDWPGATVSYYRVPWTTVEKDDGTFDFSKLDAALERAAARGERLVIRVMVMDNCCQVVAPDGEPRQFPKYLMDTINPWLSHHPWGDSWIPDWNDPDYIAAVDRLLSALGDRYDDDDRLFAVDMMGFGNWGEWHTTPFGDEGPDGQRALTFDSMKKIVDANFRAFRQTKVLSLTPWHDALQYVMDTYPQAGLRVDCLSDAAGGGAWLRMFEAPDALDRWKTQPVMTEFCTNNLSGESDIWRRDFPEWMALFQDVGRDPYAVARDQVQRYHVSLVSSDNFQHTNNSKPMTDQQYEDWSLANKFAGYRYSVTRATVPASAASGQTIHLTATWRNAGVAPTYDKWDTRVVLLDRAGREVFSTPASVDLNTLLTDNSYAGTAPVPADRTVTEKIKLPKLPGGTYTVAVKVAKVVQKSNPTGLMPASFYATPMYLAQEGRTATGAYPIGTMTIKPTGKR